MIKLDKKTDQELIELAGSLHDSINIVECFSTGDLRLYEEALKELYKRGFDIQEKKKLKITKGSRHNQEVLDDFFGKLKT